MGSGSGNNGAHSPNGSAPIPEPQPRAYRVTIIGAPWRHFEVIVPAPSPGKAKSTVYAQAIDQGYRVKYVKIRAVRAPDYDHVRPCNGDWWIGYRDGAQARGCLSVWKGDAYALIGPRLPEEEHSKGDHHD